MNITYYLGAGASANALPLYNNFRERLEIFRDFVFHYERAKKNTEFKQKVSIYIKSLDSLITRLDDTESSTLDALAYEIYNRPVPLGELNFAKLKYLVSDFFVFEQLQK